MFPPRTGPVTLRVCLPDEETPGLYGFLHVIVHSAKGFKESASKFLTAHVNSLARRPVTHMCPYTRVPANTHIPSDDPFDRDETFHRLGPIQRERTRSQKTENTRGTKPVKVNSSRR